MSNETTLEQIAIISMAYRFPGAPTEASFWRNLCDSRESILPLSNQELEAQGVLPSALNDPRYVKVAALIEGTDLFDHAFFGISKREAVYLDPQHRLFLTYCHRALELAGCVPSRCDFPIGVFGGTSMNTYLLHHLLSNPRLVDEYGTLATLIGHEKDFLTMRVSYLLDLHGPSLDIQTACSTSLVAVKFACQSLLTYECDLALAGGVTIRIPQKAGYYFREGEIYSSDGHCRPFDAAANGTVFGEGVGVVALKRLSDALRDRDTIHAVIRGSAINNDGKRKVGFTAPSVEGQIEVIRNAHSLAEVAPETITYIEAHGTGTILGDPIELAALTQAFGAPAATKPFCGIGSVKSNIGHLDAAAGIAGLIKTALALRHKQLPPTLHFQKPNPECGFDGSPFYVVSRLTPWQRLAADIPLRAGVSSFGVGGTNAHLILEEAPQRSAAIIKRSCCIVPISAKSRAGCQTAVESFALSTDDQSIAETAYTLQVGRNTYPYRCCGVGADKLSISQSMQTAFTQVPETPGASGKFTRVAFLFPGQGTQYAGMGAGLYRHEPVFREYIDRADHHLSRVLELSIARIIAGEQSDTIDEAIMHTRIAQPLLFAFEYALAQLWISLGIKPSALLGHSLGEYTAAALAQVFSFEEGLTLVTARGALLDACPPGAMTVIGLDQQSISARIPPTLALAVVNGPKLCVVGGPLDELTKFETSLSSEKIFNHRLQTAKAFHTPLVESAMQPLKERLASMTLHTPAIPCISNLTGEILTDAQAINPEYWVRHMRETVQFAQCLETLHSFNEIACIEIGPGNTLTTLAKQQQGIVAQMPTFQSVRHTKHQGEDETEFFTAVGRLWSIGYDVPWGKLHDGEKLGIVPAPTYTFEPTQCRLEEGTVDVAQTPPTTAHKRGSKKNSPQSAASKEQFLIALWQELLGARSAGPDANFFELGGHSLLAALLFSRIEQHMGISLPVSLIIETPTPRLLAAKLSGGQAQAESCIIPLHVGGNGIPVYLIHGAEGNVVLYRDLAKELGPHHPVYGIRASGFQDNEPILSTVEEMAELYLQQIRTRQPSGPFVLAGYCLGGVIAYEMACRQKERDDRVKLVAMIESFNPDKYGNLSALEKVVHHGQNIYFHGLNAVTSADKERFLHTKLVTELSRLQTKTKVSLSALAARLHLKQKYVYPHHEITIINDRAYSAYRPQPYSGDLQIFIPKTHFWRVADPHCGWDTAGARITVEKIQAYPRGMLIAPFAAKLGERLHTRIDQLQSP